MNTITFKRLLKLQNSLSAELASYLSKKFEFEIEELILINFICNEEFRSDCDGDDGHYRVKVTIQIDIENLSKIITKKLKWPYDIHEIKIDTEASRKKLNVTLTCSVYLD